MLETWRWYGPDLDPITLERIAQTGATGIVSALHEIPYGDVWTRDAIAARRQQIEAGGFFWAVVESLPVHERIKLGDGDLSGLFAAYRQSMANLAAEGIQVICYNFMPLLDWTRTELVHPLPEGGTCLRFEAHRMAAFEIYMLGREAARDDYTPETLARAADWADRATDADRAGLLSAIMAGMPGAFDRYDIAGLRRQLAHYDGLKTADIRANLARFLAEIIPTAVELGLRICIHPDDPPRNLLGLPRVVSNADDIAFILQAQDNPANGLTFCTGSLGARADNDLPAIARRFAHRIHFAHLRNVRKDPDGSFEEAAHLDGDTDMVAVIAELLDEEIRRQSTGRSDAVIPFRPDHGHVLGPDHDLPSVIGYPYVGRMRGLAELRGVIRALSHPARQPRVRST